MATTVQMLGDDITDQVLAIQTTAQAAPDYGQLVINAIPAFTGDNSEGFWDAQSSGSPFKGASDLSLFTIEIFEDGQSIYSGTIQTIRANNNTKDAIIELRSAIQVGLERGAIYASLSVAPSRAVLELAELFNIPVDALSFSTAHAIYDTDLVRITVQSLIPDNTVLSLMEQIAQIGVGRIYTENGLLHFDAYQKRDSGEVMEFTDIDSGALQTNLWSHPIVNTVEKDRIDGYSVTWRGGNATFGTSDQRARNIQAGPAAPIVIDTLQSAVWIGETWVEYLRQRQDRISFTTDLELGKSLAVNLPVKITYSQGNWDPIVADIVTVDSSDRLQTRVEVLTR